MLSGLVGSLRTDTLSTLAHDGGWDEILLIVGPMAAIAGLLVLAKRRVDAAAAALQADADEAAPDDAVPDDAAADTADDPASTSRSDGPS